MAQYLSKFSIVANGVTFCFLSCVILLRVALCMMYDAKSVIQLPLVEDKQQNKCRGKLLKRKLLRKTILVKM